MFRATVNSDVWCDTDKATRAVQEYLHSLTAAALGWRENRVAELKGEHYDAVAAELWRKVEEWCAAVASDYCGSEASVAISVAR